MSTYKSVHDVSSLTTEYNRSRSLRADARTRGYRRRIEAGETIPQIAKREGVTYEAISRSVKRVLPEDRETARETLTRGHILYALHEGDPDGYPPYAL